MTPAERAVVEAARALVEVSPFLLDLTPRERYAVEAVIEAAHALDATPHPPRVTAGEVLAAWADAEGAGTAAYCAPWWTPDEADLVWRHAEHAEEVGRFLAACQWQGIAELPGRSLSRAVDRLLRLETEPTP